MGAAVALPVEMDTPALHGGIGNRAMHRPRRNDDHRPRPAVIGCIRGNQASVSAGKTDELIIVNPAVALDLPGHPAAVIDRPRRNVQSPELLQKRVLC